MNSFNTKANQQAFLSNSYDLDTELLIVKKHSRKMSSSNKERQL